MELSPFITREETFEKVKTAPVLLWSEEEDKENEEVEVLGW